MAPLILKTLHIHPTSLEIPLSIKTVHNYNQMYETCDPCSIFTAAEGMTALTL